MDPIRIGWGVGRRELSSWIGIDGILGEIDRLTGWQSRKMPQLSQDRITADARNPAAILGKRQAAIRQLADSCNRAGDAQRGLRKPLVVERLGRVGRLVIMRISKEAGVRDH
jgi:hypothetical protein